MKHFVYTLILAAGLFYSLPGFAGDRDLDKKATTASKSVNNINIEKNTSGPVYKIQILSLAYPLPIQASVFQRVKNLKVNESVFNQQYIYTVGEYKSKESAATGLSLLKKYYQNAFVVPFVNGRRVQE